jgi:outer membrane protein OmpA-like peptidoglycan-associated protein
MDNTACSAKQILGRPNVLPIGGESPLAWSVALDQNGEEVQGESSITVAFKNAIHVRQIAVAESFNPGSVIKIILITSKNKQYKVYEAEPDTSAKRPGMLNIFIPLTDYEVKSLKLITRPDKVKGINQIDAVGVSPDEDTIKAEINCIDEGDFFSEPENLGPNINTPLNETQPIISPDGKTLFFIRENSPDKYGVVNRNIMVSSLNADNTWGFAKTLGGVLSNKGESGYSVLHDGKSLILGNVYNKDGSVSDGLSVSHKEENGWSYPEKITIKNFYTLNPNSTFFMSNDNKILLLSIERKGGYGGLDLYVSFLKDKNTYSEPVNLGPEVNTVADECSPFLAADNMTLYYSTSGFSGFGSNDIFMTRRLSPDWTKWTEPLNMGPKINSPDWDAYYTIPSSGEYAYFVSYKNSIGEGDIFRIEIPRSARPKQMINVAGRVSDSISKIPVTAKIIPLVISENRKLDEITTNKEGDFRFALPSTYKYQLTISADGFTDQFESIDLTNISDTYEIFKDIYLVKKLPVQKPEVIAAKTKKKKPETIAEKVKAKKPEPTAEKAVPAVENPVKISAKENDSTAAEIKINKPEAIAKKVEAEKPEPMAEKAVPVVENPVKISAKQNDSTAAKSKTNKPEAIAKKVEAEKPEPTTEKVVPVKEKPIKTSKNLNEIFKYEPPKTDKNIITSIFFDYNNNNLDSNSRLLLDTAAAQILYYPDCIVEVAGNADPRGHFSYNVKLSIERARKVRDYLISKKCNPKRLLLKGYSSLYPVYPNIDEQNRSFNRRVDVILLKKKRFE